MIFTPSDFHFSNKLVFKGYEPQSLIIILPKFAMTSTEEHRDGPKIPKLSRANYQSWMVKIEDYIYAIDHDEAHLFWDDFKWKGPQFEYNFRLEGKS